MDYKVQSHCFHNKPLVFLNINNFYSPLLEFFEQIYRYNFAKPEYRNLYYIADTPEECVEYIENFVPADIANKF